MTAIDDIRALMEDAAEQIAAAGALHDEALTDYKVRGRFKTRVKNVLEAQRSSLDYLAVAITEQYGTPKGPIYYPLAPSSAEFAAEMDRKMPGVAAAEPDIAAAVGRHQPHDNEHLRDLNR